MSRKQLSDFEKGKILAWSEGVSGREIGRRLKRNHRCIGRFLKHHKATGSIKRHPGGAGSAKPPNGKNTRVWRKSHERYHEIAWPAP